MKILSVVLPIALLFSSSCFPKTVLDGQLSDSITLESGSRGAILFSSVQLESDEPSYTGARFHVVSFSDSVSLTIIESDDISTNLEEVHYQGKSVAEVITSVDQHFIIQFYENSDLNIVNSLIQAIGVSTDEEQTSYQFNYYFVSENKRKIYPTISEFDYSKNEAVSASLSNLEETLGVPITTPVLVTDLDNDLKNDFLVADTYFDNGIEWFVLDSESALKLKAEDTTFDLVPSIVTAILQPMTMADLDGDRDLDMVLAYQDNSFCEGNEDYEYSSCHMYVKNEGTVNEPVYDFDNAKPLSELGAMCDTFTDFSIIEFVDLDNDGDIDIACGSNDDPGWLYEFYVNVGDKNTPIFEAQYNPFIEINLLESVIPSFVDADLDGDLDVFVGKVDGKSIIYESSVNDAGEVVLAESNLTLLGLEEGNGRFADWDNDGDLDYYISGFYESPDVSYFENLAYQEVQITLEQSEERVGGAMSFTLLSTLFLTVLTLLRRNRLRNPISKCL
ncbi:hypothetical protein Patl_0323 [Paraglaciecola sp. T6c]|uniref:FG-GAP repeat domain-containing protein n=1 Tax=Pseudoalteromonas atlantica (strain T6c / ATCC BAA-1087) TaxID=3042615 RepID=UPI00005C5EFD|nr:VCBS repeat-containing protein [Paraglaciecola sp. T6c]ABG38855.1 hypothetical protein Patl_0323 [Paraglaciecola sp. T6c]